MNGNTAASNYAINTSIKYLLSNRVEQFLKNNLIYVAVLTLLILAGSAVLAEEIDSIGGQSTGLPTSSTSSSTPSPENLVTSSLVSLPGPLWQRETSSFNGSGVYLVDGKAFLSWFWVGLYVDISQGNANGDRIAWRWTKAEDGSVLGEVGLTWNEDDQCWLPDQDETTNPCLNYTNYEWAKTIRNARAEIFELLVNGEVVYTEPYHIIGYTIEIVGNTSFSGRAGTTIATPLQAKLVDYDGVSGVPGENVVFSNQAGSDFKLVPSYSSPSSGAGVSVLGVTTNASGIAEVYVELPNRAATENILPSSLTAPINPPFYLANPEFTVTAEFTEVEDVDFDKNQGESDDCFNTVNVGNPINVATGNKFQKEEDITGSSATPLEFTRYYNLTESDISTIGSNWRHSYHRELTITKEGSGQSAINHADIKRPDGKGFRLTDSGSGFVGGADIDYQLVKQSGKWRLRTDRDELEIYDGKGKLLSITDVRGNVQELDYDNQKRLSGVKSSSNEELIFTYNASDILVGVEYLASSPDPASPGQSRNWSYNYISGFLSSVTNPDGAQRIYHYESPDFPHALTGITDERGIRFATWEYDETGIAASSYHGVNVNRVDIAYDVNGERTVTDSLGNVTDYTAVSQLGTGKVTTTTGPTCSTGDQSVATYQYDPNTNDLLSSTIDGVTTQFGNYDTNGNPGFEIEAVGTAFERRKDFTYDSRFQNKVTSITEPSVHTGSNKVTTMTYDEFGNLLSQTINGFKPDGTAITRTTTFQYNGPYKQLSQINGPRTDVSDITTFEYYADDANLYQHQGMLLRVTSPEGIVLRDNLQYNALRQLISETRPNGLTMTYTWESNTERMSSMTETVGAASRTTSWTYLPTGEVESVTFPDSTTLTYSYDDARRLTRVTDSLGNYIQYNLDTEGNVLDEIIYDAGDVLQKAVVRSFDVYNRLDGLAQANEIMDYDYSADGTLAKEVNGNAVQTDYSYDDLKRLVSTDMDSTGSDPSTANSLIGQGYDSQDNLTSVTDPKSSQTTYSFDDLGNLVAQVSPDTGTTTFAYDEAGNRIQTMDAKGQIFIFAYDALNRLLSRDAPGTEHDLAYAYDSCTNGVGRICSVSRSINTTQYAYNGFGDLTQKVEAVQTSTAVVNSTLGISYDAAGRIQTISYPGNTGVTYGYDVLGNVNTLSLDRNGQITNVISNATYKPFGPVIAMMLGNGINRTITYDDAYRLTAINDPVYDTVITYDPNGNIIDQTRTSGNLSTGYDALDKLTDASGPLGTQAYQYDKNANRTLLTDNAVNTSYTYEPLSNRMSQLDATAVVLDANGNTTLLRGMNLQYSPDNRLTGITGTASYGYNGLGERILKNDLTKETVFLYGPQGQLLAELSNTGQIDKAYIYFNGQPVAMVDNLDTSNGTLYYSHNDHLGTPQALTDESDTTVWQASYKPFGLATVNDDPDGDTNTITFNLRFAGQYFDAESSLHYNYYRDYDPTTGRYVQSDPIGLVGGLNTYGYANQNSLAYIDPYGRDAIYINYDYYPVTTPLGTLPLGHGAVVAIDPQTGVTKYYEFGRYGDPDGVVRGAPDIKIPNVEIGENGLPTEKSLNDLYKYLSENLGKGSHITPTYYPDSDFQGVIDFAEEFRKNHPDYDLLFNNCKTFGRAAATACKEDSKCQ